MPATILQFSAAPTIICEIQGHPLREVRIDGQRYREWAGYLFRRTRYTHGEPAFQLIPKDDAAMRMMILEALC